MSVIGSAGSSGAFDKSGSQGPEGLVSGAAVTVDYSVGIAFGGHHPNLLYFCKWGNSVPIHIALLLVVLLYWGLVDPGPGPLFWWVVLK